jgi:membrane associated rhomboid family serine protease
VTAPELSVVCKSCGSEVSPYVTECPYCGTRLRKRAPKLERKGDEILASERPKRRRRRRREGGLPRLGAMGRPYGTLAAILAPAILFLVQVAADLAPSEVGAIVGPVGSEWWRYLAAPFAYDDLGYLFVCCVALGIFVPSLERRLGTPSAVILLLACGALGMLAADALDSIEPGELLVAAGGNGMALGAVLAWAAIRQREARADPGDDYDAIGVAVVAAVLLLLPLVETYASIVAGLTGGLVGALAGWAAARATRPDTAR